MEYLINFALFTLAFLIAKFLPSYLTKKGENLATKEDIGKITHEIETVKNVFKDQRDLSKTEKEFYLNMIEKIYQFSSEIKKYEFENNRLATNEDFLQDADLKNKLFEFKDSASEFIGKSFVFLKEENYLNLKKALKKTSTYADLTNNLLDAMRKSIHPDTKLSSENDLTEFKY
jgi:hypothetical protein